MSQIERIFELNEDIQRLKTQLTICQASNEELRGLLNAAVQRGRELEAKLGRALEYVDGNDKDAEIGDLEAKLELAEIRERELIERLRHVFSDSEWVDKWIRQGMTLEEARLRGSVICPICQEIKCDPGCPNEMKRDQNK